MKKNKNFFNYYVLFALIFNLVNKLVVLDYGLFTFESYGPAVLGVLLLVGWIYKFYVDVQSDKKQMNSGK